MPIMRLCPASYFLQNLFDYQRQLIKTLVMKWGLGIRITEAYREQNREELKKYLKTLEKLKKEVSMLKELAMQVWYHNNKPFGSESLDLKLGGVIARIETAITRISMFLDYRIDRIEELEEERLLYKGQDICSQRPLVNAHDHASIAKASV